MPYFTKLEIHAALQGATTGGLTTLGGTTANLTASTLVISNGGGGMQVDASNVAGQQYGGETAIFARKAAGSQAQQLRTYSRYRPNVPFFSCIWNSGYTSTDATSGGGLIFIHSGGPDFQSTPIGKFHEQPNKCYQYEEYTSGVGPNTVAVYKIYQTDPDGSNGAYVTWLTPADEVSVAGQYTVTVLDNGQTARIAVPNSGSAYGLTAVLGEGSPITLTDFVYADTVPNTAFPPLTCGVPVVTNLTATSADLTVSPSGGEPPLTYYWEKNTSGTSGAWEDVGLPGTASVSVSGLTADTLYDYRCHINDAGSQSITVGKDFSTPALATALSAYFLPEFGENGLLKAKLVPSGGDGNYTYAWGINGTQNTLTPNNATANQQTFLLTCTDVEIRHSLFCAIADGTGRQWTLNNTGYPAFSSPVRPYLRQSDIVLYPTSITPIALPAGYAWGQEGDSTSQSVENGQSTSFYVGQQLNAAKGITTVVAGFFNSSFGGSSQSALATASATVDYLTTNNITDCAFRLGYNDNTVPITAAQSNTNIRDLIAYVAANATTVQRIWILPTTFRGGGFAEWGDGGEARLRELQTLLSPLHDTLIGGKRIYFGSVLPYDLSQADANIYEPGSYTHFNDAGARAIGAYDANSVLTVFPVAANVPITGLAARATRRFVFPVAGTIAGQMVTWSVARTGGAGAAYGTISSTTGLYTAPNPLPTTAGASDTITGTAANGARTSVVVQLVAQAGTVATPTISPVAGTYTSVQTVTLACSTSGAVIHYTLDGATPTSFSPTYTAPLSVPATATVKALAVKGGMTNSAVASALFTINIPSAGAAQLTNEQAQTLARLAQMIEVNGGVPRFTASSLSILGITDGADVPDITILSVALNKNTFYRSAREMLVFTITAAGGDVPLQFSHMNYYIGFTDENATEPPPVSECIPILPKGGGSGTILLRLLLGTEDGSETMPILQLPVGRKKAWAWACGQEKLPNPAGFVTMI